ncbi:MAG: aa3-type cytochrome c oxidase subunit IV [Litorimonas sp.]
MAKTNYTRGEMEITDHEGTFSGFMGVSMYGAAAIIMLLLFPILIFGANVAWPMSLLITVVLGLVIGAALKFKAQWFAGLIGSAIFLGVVIALLLLLF